MTVTKIESDWLLIYKLKEISMINLEDSNTFEGYEQHYHALNENIVSID